MLHPFKLGPLAKSAFGTEKVIALYKKHLTWIINSKILLITAICVLSISQYKESSLCFENTTDAELLVWLGTTLLFPFISLAWRKTLWVEETYWFIFSHSLLCEYCHNKDILKYTVKHNSSKRSLWELQVIHTKYV